MKGSTEFLIHDGYMMTDHETHALALGAEIMGGGVTNAAFGLAAAKFAVDEPQHRRALLACATAMTLWAAVMSRRLKPEPSFGGAITILGIVAGGPLDPKTMDATTAKCRADFERAEAA